MLDQQETRCGNLKCTKSLSPLQMKGGIRFCSRSCSNSAIKRISSAASKEKLKTSLRNLAKTKECVCVECGVTFTVIPPKRRRKICGKRECYYASKCKQARKAALTMKQNGTHAGWHNRRFESSYPEKYFISLFQSENITGWEREKKVGRWFIDFAFTDKMLAVEIDGRQHQDPDRKIKDQEKDAYLEDCGYRVIRIPWNNPRTEKGRLLLHPHVASLLEILRR